MKDRPSYPNEGKPPIDETDNAEMYGCLHFNECSAPMCPKDRHIDYRTWFIGEEICRVREYRNLGYIRRQRQLNKRRSPTYRNKLWTYQELVETAPNKRSISPEHRAKLLAASRRHQFGQKPVSQNRDFHSVVVG
jgi:hypothetical protein